MNSRAIMMIVLVLAVAGLYFSGQIRDAHAKVSWPPQMNQAFPKDVEFIDQSGQKVKMSDYQGEVLLVEYVGMTCPACQAFSGGNKKDIGPFENAVAQSGLKSIEEFFPRYTQGLSLSDDRIAHISILLYDMRMGPTQADDAKKWAEHFRFKKSRKQHVLVPTQDLRGNASYNLIPGFQLFDRELNLRADSTGHHPKHNLYTQLLPMVPELLQ